MLLDFHLNLVEGVARRLTPSALPRSGMADELAALGCWPGVNFPASVAMGLCFLLEFFLVLLVGDHLWVRLGRPICLGRQESSGRRL